MSSSAAGVPPTAAPHVRTGELAPPERYRSYDEAAVLVGNCKTIDESEKVLHQVKKIRPRCLDNHGEAFFHRTGHGIGLDGHEDPYLVAGNDLPLAPGMAFSVEPGIYYPGTYGARIEDIVVCATDGPVVLNEAPRELYVVDG